MKIAILYICVGKYDIFWKDFYLSCNKNFLIEDDIQKDFFVFTDADYVFNEDKDERIHKIYQKDLGWPDNVLMRFHMFNNILDKLKYFDYAFFFNANIIFNKTINQSEFLPKDNQNLLATNHPGFFNKKRNKFTYEKNKSSTAYVSNDQGRYYFAGGLNGGKSEYFIEAILKMKENIDIDKKNNIIAIWHDESHWNKYLINRKDVKILGPEYLYVENSNMKIDQKIILIDKRRYIDYVKMGKRSGTVFHIFADKIISIFNKYFK